MAQKGCGESAWARSTTTRESPVHTAMNDGLSSLFSIIDHSPVVQDPFQKGVRTASRSRSAEPRPELGPGQDTSPSSRGRSPSPIGGGSETCREEGGEGTPLRQDLSAPPGYTLTENVARILHRKLLEHALKEERRQAAHSPTNSSSDNHMGEAVVKAEPGSIEVMEVESSPHPAPTTGLSQCGQGGPWGCVPGHLSSGGCWEDRISRNTSPELLLRNSSYHLQ